MGLKVYWQLKILLIIADFEKINSCILSFRFKEHRYTLLELLVLIELFYIKIRIR